MSFTIYADFKIEIDISFVLHFHFNLTVSTLVAF
jgi:hypothetical protein